MMDELQVDEYNIKGDIFQKHHLPNGSNVRYFKNQKELTIAEWNRELNIIQPMSLLENHPNPIIKLKERHRRKSFLRLIKPAPSDTIADVGCESGYLAERLIDKCQKIYCIDIDEGILSLARERLHSKKAEFIQSDIQRIQLEDNAVDITIGAEILEHLPNPKVGLRELVRITKPFGRIFISVPNEPMILLIKKGLNVCGLSFFLGKLNPRLAIGHLNVLNKKKIRDICMGIAKIEKLYYNPPFFMNIFAKLKPLK